VLNSVDGTLFATLTTAILVVHNIAQADEDDQLSAALGTWMGLCKNNRADNPNSFSKLVVGQSNRYICQTAARQLDQTQSALIGYGTKDSATVVPVVAVELAASQDDILQLQLSFESWAVETGRAAVLHVGDVAVKLAKVIFDDWKIIV